MSLSFHDAGQIYMDVMMIVMKIVMKREDVISLPLALSCSS